MADDRGEDGGAKVRKRPEIQIYRPGMMRKGTDVTSSGSIPSAGSLPPDEKQRRPPRSPYNDSGSGSVGGGGGRYGGSMSNMSAYNRRRSNDTDSVHSYRGDSGSTTPDAASLCGERRSSGGSNRGAGVRTFIRGGGGPRYDRRDERDRYSGYGSRNNSQLSSRQGSHESMDDRSYDKAQRGGRNSNQPYNSTQSLYDSRRPGGYLDQGGGGSPRYSNDRYDNSDRRRNDPRSDGNRLRPSTARNSKFERNNSDRASMRAEIGHRRAAAGGGGGGGRRRNDSITSTQSERPPQNDLRVDTGPETQSQAGDAPSSSSMSYSELCKSFDSIGTFDWSKEVEDEYNEKMREEEERKTKELEERLAHCNNIGEVQEALKNQGKIRGIIHVNIGSTPSTAATNSRPSPNSERGGYGNRGSSNYGNDHRGYNDSGRGRGHNTRGRGRTRHDSDRSSSIAGSITEEDLAEADEDDEEELASGERTPTREIEQPRFATNRRGGRVDTRGGRDTREPYRPRGGAQQRSDKRNSGYYENEYGERESGRESKYHDGYGSNRENRRPVPTGGRLQGRITVARNEHDDDLADEQPDDERTEEEQQPRQPLSSRGGRRNVEQDRGAQHRNGVRASDESAATTSARDHYDSRKTSSSGRGGARGGGAGSRQQANREPRDSGYGSVPVYDPRKAAAASLAKRGGAEPQRTSVDEAMPKTSSSSQPRQQSSSGAKQMNDYPVYQEIASREGPQISTINEEITAGIEQIKMRRDVEAAKKMVALSAQLSAVYYDIVTRDISFTFAMNLEQHLYKQAFYKIIDCLKSSSNTTHESAKTFREQLLAVAGQGIEFYTKLIERYETDLEISLADALLWPNGLPSDDFQAVVPTPMPLDKFSQNKQKTALKSCSRLVLALGDLYRVKTLVEGSENYSIARSYYLKAVQLWSASGHGYNQLAVVAFFSERVLDEIFFFVRAICAGHPFEMAKEKLSLRFAAMRKKVSQYEPLLDSETGQLKEEIEIVAASDRPREIWLSVDGTSVDACDSRPTDVFNSYLELPGSKLHRRTISYVVNTFGLLITKIGMEMFTSVSERAICQLAALLQQEDSPITSTQLIQIALLSIYSVHATALQGVDADTCSVQQQQSVRVLITLYGVLLRQIGADANVIRKWLVGEEAMPRTVSRVLPALTVLSEWISCPTATSIYRTMPYCEALRMTTLQIDTWQLLADLTNVLFELEDEAVLVSVAKEAGGDVASCVPPEMAFVASFLSVFPQVPKPFHAKKTACLTVNSGDVDQSLLSIHVRLRLILLAAEYLDGSDLECFGYDQDLQKFVRSEASDGEVGGGGAGTLKGDRRNTMIRRDGGRASPDDERQYSREDLLERERRKRKIVIVVKPLHVVPDTNAFVDHLDEVMKIVESGAYHVLVPTIVIDELTGLAQNRHAEADDAHTEFVTSSAKRAVAWLKQMAQEKCQRMGTITTKGQRLVISVMAEEVDDRGESKINDDRILSSCVAFVERYPPLSFEAELTKLGSNVARDGGPEPIYRNLVLLSGDRGMNIKATTNRVPCRTLPSFLRWAKLK